MKEVKINNYLSIRLTDEDEVQILLFNKVAMNLPVSVANALADSIKSLTSKSN
jgi:hypothetical protein